ncbi:cytochrome c3 family protein [Geopsychrobacter electrodiphilus]|uniref:cytochrome c3 family protein n=1 Tax=Geopsychrobacter electrodiphilus TaxID=225196 RepID=UPI0003748CBB|nr:cytochrome c3 family protein [Geopsychrobacter electrodiphilus]
MNKRLAIILSLIAASSLILSGVLSARSNDGHDFSGKCETCHLTSPHKGSKNLFTMDIDTLCIECHDLALKNSHPTKMIPSMNVPEYFFLDWQGRVNCATCHDPHDKESKMMLRSDARGRSFCETCHKGGVLQGRHVAASGMAHAKNWTPPSSDSIGQILDPVSLECLVCHEGSVGPAAEVQIGSRSSGQGLSYTGPGFSHPIGVDYGQAAARNKELRRLDDLSPLISLYEGKVGCASCHNQFSHEGDMLVFSNRGSALCLECHIK